MIAKTDTTSLQSFMPAMFTMEAWFRLDPVDLRPDGYLSQIFAVYDASINQYIYGMAMTNSFLRVYLN